MTNNPENSNVHLAVRPQWLALRQEEILEPELPIIDAHHHLWDKPGNQYLFQDLLADTGSGHNIQATVFMECGSMYRQSGDPMLRPVGETEFAAGVAAMSASGQYGSSRICAAIVGYADLQYGHRVDEALHAHLAAAGGRLRGIRNISAWHSDPKARGSMANPPSGLLLDKSFQEGFSRLAPHGLVFDAWMYHTQLDELAALAALFPETTIVLNHVGGPIGIGPYADRRDEVFNTWRASIQRLSALPNIAIKLGGFGMRLFGFGFHEDEIPAPSSVLAQAWRPYIETCVEAFGPDRCMFESNFPVDKGMHGYAVAWNAFKRATTGYSAGERSDLFHDTAARVYRVGHDTSP